MNDFVDTDLERRMEYLFLYDGSMTNPNGNPMSSNDKPRVDTATNRALVTDARLKRFLRDQMSEDGYSVYLKSPDGGSAKDRTTLFTEAIGMSEDEVGEKDASEVYSTFLQNAMDVRMFGAPLSVDSELLDNEDGISFLGPVQFGQGESIHEVFSSQATKKRSTTVASSEDSNQGTFAEDNRLRYALIRFTGTVNEVSAENTGLSQSDVEYLTTALWRAIKNQTLSQSKTGHSPQLLLRADYEPKFHSNGLQHAVSLDTERSAPANKLRNIRDAVIDVTELIELLQEDLVQENLRKLNVRAGRYAQFSYNGEVGEAEDLYGWLREVADVEVIEPYE